MAETFGAITGGVTIVDVALKSTKSIYHTFSAAKDGPRIVATFTDRVAGLQGVLEKLSQLPVDASTDTTASRMGAVQHCKDDLARFEVKLKHQGITENDCRGGKIWKMIKLAFNEKKLAQMQETVDRHIWTLTMHLSTFQFVQISASAAQNFKMLELMREMKDLLLPSAASASAGQGDVSSFSSAQAEPACDDDTSGKNPSDLEESINRIMQAIEMKDCMVESDGASQITRDLEKLLESAARSGPGVENARDSLKDGEGAAAQCFHVDDMAQEMKLARNILGSAPSIHVNKGESSETGLGFLHSVSKDPVLHQSRKRKIIEIGSGTLSINTAKRRRTSHRENSHADAESGAAHLQEFIAKISFRPKNCSIQFNLSLNQVQRLANGVFSSIPPRLCIGSTIVCDAPIFKAAAAGCIPTLVNLLNAGRHTIHDRDYNGWSLLFYAVEHPPMCRYLLSLGLDADEVATDGGGHQTSPLFEMSRHDNFASLSTLLEAGADPTQNSTNGVCFLLREQSVTLCVLELSPFCMNLESVVTIDGSNALLALFKFGECLAAIHGAENWLKTHRALLDRGLNFDSTSTIGQTCLHLAFETPGYHDNGGAWMEGLCHAIRNGADVYAVDYLGRSVADMAYHSGICSVCELNHGSYPGDLFDAVLDSCGFDIARFRRQWPRRAFYTENYTRNHFEELWKGREHRCPYWNNEEWPVNNFCHELERRRREEVRFCYCGDDHLDYIGEVTHYAIDELF